MMIDLSMPELRIAVIALRKAAHTSHPLMAICERQLAYKFARHLPPSFSVNDLETDDMANNEAKEGRPGGRP
jgi:hypothetical protein